VLVTSVGVLLLSNLAKAPDTMPAAAPVETAIETEAVFKIIPRETAEAPTAPAKTAAARAANPKPVAVSTPMPPRKPLNESPGQVASAPAPLPIVQIPAQPQTTAAIPDNTVMGKLRSTTAAVQRIPQWAASSVAGWFSADAPPRPPAPVPTQNFQATM
jgi:2-oxoglutarate dehydrogenase complex dehydrogenase (E1) component-like enzyme